MRFTCLVCGETFTDLPASGGLDTADENDICSVCLREKELSDAARIRKQGREALRRLLFSCIAMTCGASIAAAAALWPDVLDVSPHLVLFIACGVAGCPEPFDTAAEWVRSAHIEDKSTLTAFFLIVFGVQILLLVLAVAICMSVLNAPLSVLKGLWQYARSTWALRSHPGSLAARSPLAAPGARVFKAKPPFSGRLAGLPARSDAGPIQYVRGRTNTRTQPLATAPRHGRG